MKMLLVLLLGCTPLAVLTAFSFLDKPPAAAATQVEQNGWNAAEVPQQTSAELARVTELESLTEGLVALDPLDINELPEVKVPAAVTSPADVTNAVTRATLAHDRVIEVSRTLSGLKPDAGGLSLLVSWQETNPLAGLTGEGNFAAYIDRLYVQVSAIKTFTDGLDDAKRLIDEKKYTEALTTLESLEKTGRSQAELDDKEELIRQAKFWQHWDVSDSAQYTVLTQNVALYKERLETLRKLAATTGLPGTPAAVLDTEKNHLRWLADAQRFLENEIAYETFLTDPPEDPKEFLDRLKAILLVHSKRAFQLKKPVMAWVPKHLREKGKAPSGSTPARPRLQEAVLKSDGRLLLGTFVESSSKKFYTFTPAPNSKVTKVEYPDKDKLVALPATPRDVKWIADYNELRSRLQKNAGVKADWVRLQKLCETAESELPAYRRQRDALGLPVSVSFADEKRFVDTVLARWSVLGDLYHDENR